MGPPGLGGAGLGLEIRRTSEDTVITMPEDVSVAYLVSVPRGRRRDRPHWVPWTIGKWRWGRSRLLITLPPAASAAARFVAIQRVNSSGNVWVSPQPGEMIGGTDKPLRLTSSRDTATLVTDGTHWFVLSLR